MNRVVFHGREHYGFRAEGNRRASGEVVNRHGLLGQLAAVMIEECHINIDPRCRRGGIEHRAAHDQTTGSLLEFSLDDAKDLFGS